MIETELEQIIRGLLFKTSAASMYTKVHKKKMTKLLKN